MEVIWSVLHSLLVILKFEWLCSAIHNDTAANVTAAAAKFESFAAICQYLQH